MNATPSLQAAFLSGMNELGGDLNRHRQRTTALELSRSWVVGWYRVHEHPNNRYAKITCRLSLPDTINHEQTRNPGWYISSRRLAGGLSQLSNKHRHGTYTNGQVVTDRFWDLGCGEPWKAMLLQIRFYKYAQDDHYKPQLGKFMNSTPIK